VCWWVALERQAWQRIKMKFDHMFMAFGLLAGAGLSLVVGQWPAVATFAPPLLLLLALLLIFDLATAYIRNMPVMQSVSTTTRFIAFCGGAVALVLSGGMA
jgi:hypothetical protein